DLMASLFDQEPEQIIRILREADTGVGVEEVCRRHNVSTQSYYRWKAKYGGMDLKEAQRLKDLEKENGELKKMLADQMLKARALEIALEKTSKPGAAARTGRESTGRAAVFRAQSVSVAGVPSFDDEVSSPASSGSATAAGAGNRAAVGGTSNDGVQEDHAVAPRQR
ncbi:MAG: hypothetical protein BGO12_00330, partial [Verrucomicrobia bacterium 61-8]